KVNQLVRVYPINEEQYERLQKLTNGKNVISEARLTSAGFTSVRDSLDNGWNSLLRIMGLTTTTRSDDVAKIDIDGQPLCVMRRSLDDAEPRAAARDAYDEDSVINCIVVLKKDPALEPQSIVNTNPNFAPYWYNENAEAQPTEVQANAEQLPAVEQPAAPAVEPEQPQLDTAAEPNATPIIKLTNKPKSGSKSKRKYLIRQKTRKTAADTSAPRQYGQYGQPPPPPPPPPYGAGYGSPYDNSYGYGQSPYSPFSSYPAPPAYPPSGYPAGPYPASPSYPPSGYPASSFPPSGFPPTGFSPSAYPPPPPPYAPQLPNFPPQPFGQPSPFGQYPYAPYREQTVSYDDDDEDDGSYEVDADGSY
ncbi:hypothetical protein KR222_003025, partial [Zaprionus bogoriensis]